MRTFLFLLAILFVYPSFLSAQSVADEVTLIQSAFGMEKQALVKEAMQLSADKEEAFWAVYRVYEDERRALARQRLGLINEYLDKYETMTDVQAEDLAKRSMQADIAVTKLHQKYFGRFKKATSSMDAAKFLQLDRHIHSTIRLVLTDKLPFLVERSIMRK